jgi:hypothetical protein
LPKAPLIHPFYAKAPSLHPCFSWKRQGDFITA